MYSISSYFPYFWLQTIGNWQRECHAQKQSHASQWKWFRMENVNNYIFVLRINTHAAFVPITTTRSYSSRRLYKLGILTTTTHTLMSLFIKSVSKATPVLALFLVWFFLLSIYCCLSNYEYCESIQSATSKASFETWCILCTLWPHPRHQIIHTELTLTTMLLWQTDVAKHLLLSFVCSLLYFRDGFFFLRRAHSFSICIGRFQLRSEHKSSLQS